MKTDNWGFYERLSETEQMRVLINIGYNGSAPLPNYTELLSITVNLYPVRESNRTNRQFVQQLEQLESKLEQWLKSTSGAIYIGRINASTRLEFYYYLEGGRLTDEQLHAWLGANWRFRAQAYRKEDAAWSFYFFLLPSAMEQLFVHNAQMIYALIHKGDNIGEPRNVYHWLLFREDGERSEMEELLEAHGYVIEREKEGKPETDYPYPLVISKFEDVRLDTINERVRDLYRLLDGRDGRYDGWGAAMRLSRTNRIRRYIRRRVEFAQSTLRKVFAGRS
ncbi:DUF695 domain-containing protein [Paenibacillus sp. R14(2021)]|uniref:DUF695 domain-containing protein n=1 Tax=Paenibacillus sp. R14(2021) TaxID=2859228 RepID=UPI001C6117A2|nr:DUF695 domain-containing protein [Paenibacillus sp. R14(2021)]